MKQLVIHAFFDTRKGHEKQTQAVVQALAGLTPVTVVEHRLPCPTSLDRVVDWLRYLLAAVLPRQDNVCVGADVIIGTGSRCHIPMLLAGKQGRAGGARIITCMTPDRILRNKFDLCLIPQHDAGPDVDNIFKTLGPPCPVANQGQHDATKGLILIGGIDEKSHHWQTPVVVEQVKEMLRTASTISWTISSSPRTPVDTVMLLEKIGQECDNATFFRAEDTGNGWIEEQYDQNKTVWVTADSISMVYEALSAGCQVGVLPVTWKKNNNKFQRSLTGLSEKKLIILFEEWQAGRAFGQQDVLLDEAASCARAILRRWWPEKLA